MKKFIIEEEEKNRILRMHNSLKEQVQGSSNQPPMSDKEKLTLALRTCIKNYTWFIPDPSPLRKGEKSGKDMIVGKDSNGDTFYFYADLKVVNQRTGTQRTWKCDEMTPTPIPVGLETNPILKPEQQKEVDELIARYPTIYRKDKPTADQIGKKEWTELQLNKIKGFETLGIPDNYKIWEKSGKRQTMNSQQEEAIKTYTDAGWQDIGGKVNPAEADKYDTIDLIDIYPDDFKESYKLVKPIESVDTNELIEELNTLVGTKNFGDRKTCRNIISKYNLAKQKDAPINAAILQNWKIAVNACKTKVDNFNDINATKNILRTLTNPPTDKNGAPIAPKKDSKGNDIPVSEKDKKWAINIRKKETPKENQPAAGATQPVAPTAGAPTN
jgi:hypothetical protein